MAYTQTWRRGLLVVWLTTFLWTAVFAQEPVPVSELGVWRQDSGFRYTIDTFSSASFTIPGNTLWDRVVITASGYARVGQVFSPRNYQIFLNGAPFRTGTPEGTTISTSDLRGKSTITLGIAIGAADGLVLYGVEAFIGTTSTQSPTATLNTTTELSTSSSNTSRSVSTPAANSTTPA